MAYLINRNPSGRIICLHALLKYLNNKFGSDPFTLNDLKYDDESKYNIHQTCKLLKKFPSILHPVCPFLENPLSQAKCYLTQSIKEDKQKSKSVSDAFNALEGLGFVERTDKGGALTKNGVNFASHDYDDDEVLPILRKALLSYGPFVGLISEFINTTRTITKSDIKLGYPNTIDKVFIKKQLVILSTGSQIDTIRRTRSTLFIWAISGGFALPDKMPIPKNKKQWHMEVIPYIQEKKWSATKFKTFLNTNLFSPKPIVDNPLTYLSMTKSTRSLRERNQELVRNTSLQFESIIKNRRFAIVYLLAKASENEKKVNLTELINHLKIYPDLFVINTNDFDNVISTELEIAQVAGIPYEYNNNILKPLTKVNIVKLSIGAPSPLISTLDNIYPKIIL